MFLHNSRPQTPDPGNEPILNYAPGSPERAALQRTLEHMSSSQLEIPVVIAGKRIRTGKTVEVRSPQNHRRVLGTVHLAGAAEVDQAADAARAAWRDWSRMRWEARAAVFLRAAELLAGKHRQLSNASTMLGQGKTCHQAEIDAACELVDFWRWNVHFAAKLYGEQPASAPGMWNALELRPLEGFVFAVSPFNFTAIGGNLPAAAALMGNTVVWKPATTAVLSNYYIFQLLEEAGLPPGVINMVPGDGPTVGAAALRRPDLAGVHFTGSTGVFQWMWRLVGENIASYRTYPRLVGETGGKDFLIAHPSADPQALVTAAVRGAYEYQGQKCSALSRLYVAESVWAKIERELIDTIQGVKMGDVADFSNFMGAVIDRKSWQKIKGAIDSARGDAGCQILAGGECSDADGWFIRPTLVRVRDPKHNLMQEEWFGPLLSVYVYPDAGWEDALRTVDETSPYALTGAVFANDRGAVNQAHDALRHAAGNFYVNDKPTGAVVGQQPFGGARASGTNDKAGSWLNLVRWVSARTVKENLAPPSKYAYPYMG